MNISLSPCSRLRIWCRETDSAVPSRVSLLISHTLAESGIHIISIGARLFRAPIWCPSGDVAARERQGALSRRAWQHFIGWVRTSFGEDGGQLDRRRARGVMNPCARESKARTRRFLREKLMSDHGLLSSYEGYKKRRTGKISGDISRMHRALEGWMLTRAPASPAQGLHHHGPRYFNFPYFCTMCGLEKLELVDQN